MTRFLQRLGSGFHRRAAVPSAVLLAAMLLTAMAQPELALASPSLANVIDRVQPRIVKIYGAGGFRGLESYQSGFLISDDGFVLTLWSYVLDADYITVVLNDGRKYQGQLVGADPRLELAVLKIDATRLPHFDLRQSPPAGEATRVLAFSNLYGVASGDEPASVQQGLISAVTTLEARRGVFQTPYRGPVYVLDAMTNNPGAAGGALTDWQGQLLGVLGKELRDERSNLWLNYALPIHEIADAVEALRSGDVRSVADPARGAIERPLTLEALGIVLVPNVLERTPPFVDAVRPGSAAAAAGFRTDDLIVFVNNQLAQSSNILIEELAQLDADAPVRFTLMRGSELIELELTAPSAAP